ncbi:helix-loop-helix protein delilah-like [Onthophagus taurus]|uniref:helix-loop-helix protein delilah-like n=1 Tax=Onthophagus taurus TaxID=166361 RepID=UPI000C1FE39B|nr:helix-loop-helix protein delilah-like [Onthophagus taurus]
MENLLTNYESTLQNLKMTYPDPNNNENSSKEDKYSLRPRSVRRVTEVLMKQTQSQTEQSPSKVTKPHKPKQKPAPLSKYRRKTANARERNRMREINQAFESLRRAIPHMAPAQATTASNEKLTKITTLRLAMKYIATLSAALSTNPDPKPESISDCSDLDYFLLESDGESLPLSDHSFLASPDFGEPSLSPVDFGDPTLPQFLHTDFPDHGLESTDFSDFLLT